MYSLSKREEALLVKGLLVSESWDLETSRTSTRVGKEEIKKEGLVLLVIHMPTITTL
jgi:hypothetical protein